MSTDQFQGPPPVGFLRRLVLLLGLVVGLAAIIGLILGGALLLETFI